MLEPVGGPFLPRVSGQEFAKRYFERALALERLSHAYLLVGPEGSGKRLFAAELSKAFFCAKGNPCGACASCRSIDHHNHPGVHVYRPAEGKSIVDIETVRALCDRTHYCSEHLQVAILEEADKLNEPAANALLKTLEEPPGKVLLLLLAQSSGALPQTLVSRCHRIPFTPVDAGSTPLSPEQVTILKEVLDPGFFARHDPRVWARGLFPEETGLKNALRRLLAALLKSSRFEDEAPDGQALDESLRLLESLLELRQDLERNINPDLVLERLLVTLRQGTAVFHRVPSRLSAGLSAFGDV